MSRRSSRRYVLPPTGPVTKRRLDTAIRELLSVVAESDALYPDDPIAGADTDFVEAIVRLVENRPNAPMGERAGRILLRGDAQVLVAFYEVVEILRNAREFVGQLDDVLFAEEIAFVLREHGFTISISDLNALLSPPGEGPNETWSAWIASVGGPVQAARQVIAATSPASDKTLQQALAEQNESPDGDFARAVQEALNQGRSPNHRARVVRYVGDIFEAPSQALDSFLKSAFDHAPPPRPGPRPMPLPKSNTQNSPATYKPLTGKS